MVLLIGVALVAALIARHSTDRRELRDLALVGGVGLGLRLAAIAVIYFGFIALRIHPEGVWLNDEASYYRSTDALMPWPWDNALPQGLDHLAGNGYLGLTTVISLAVGVDATAFRIVNAALGAIVALMCLWLARALFGRTAGLIAGLGAAVWPDLVLWSATMLRDTLASFAVVGIWWALLESSLTRATARPLPEGEADDRTLRSTLPEGQADEATRRRISRLSERQRWLTTACFVVLGLVLVASLRTYLAVAMAAGVVGWLVYPFVRRVPARTLIVAGLGLVSLGVVLGIVQSRRLDEMAHELLYRQTVTRMETLGRLYRDPPPSGQPVHLPFRPGEAIALVDPQTGWLSPGLVEDSSQPGQLTVGLTDDTSRTVPLDGHVVLLKDANIPPIQLFSWALPSLLAVVLGLPTTNDAPNIGVIGAALAWDALLAVAVFGVARSRLALRDWVYPLCVGVGTIAALTAIPGAPGNAERHRATQTVPLLLVLASGALASRTRATWPDGRAVPSPTSMPTSASTAVISSRRSAR